MITNYNYADSGVIQLIATLFYDILIKELRILFKFNRVYVSYLRFATKIFKHEHKVDSAFLQAV
jgi:hypothetical protein